IVWKLFNRNKRNLSHEQLIANYLKDILGIRPSNISLYSLALIHRSASNFSAVGQLNNERLEYLGDAVLDAVIAEYLFKKFPFKPEGELTEMRSKLVNRERLSSLSKKIRLNELITIDTHSHAKSAEGDAFEALVGAIFLDKGYNQSRKIILYRIFFPYLDIDTIFEEESNYKSKIINWGQKRKKKITFRHAEVECNKHSKLYKVELLIDDEVVAEGLDYTVKKAEKIASERACGIVCAESSKFAAS
ncbi:MAG TPA: ribonuclease III, partial [Bacteroidales bacterium]|nr:ribonuclease III [Bacteroidales bacterium]HPT52215.1 ribonuclease III [Bacteroidales bacterium]